MKHRAAYLWRLVTFAGFVLLGACASTHMVSIEYTRDFYSGRIQKVLIVGVFKSLELRQAYENEFVRQWKTRGVEAVAAWTVLPPGIPPEKSSLAPMARAMHFDSVLVTRPLGRKTMDPHTGRPKVTETEEQPPDDKSLTRYFQTWIAVPQYDLEYQLAVLRTNLYDVASDQRIWSGMSQTFVSSDISKLIRPFIKVILKSLYENE